MTSRANGKVNAVAKLTLNGDSMSVESTVPQEGGKDLKQSATLKRIAKGSGFPGKWRSLRPDTDELWFEFTPDGADGLKMAAPNSLCVAKFDGKPYSMSGPGDPPKQTMSFRKRGPGSLEVVTYLDGKVFFTDVYTASSDGKELTDISTSAATKKPSKVIFDRQ
jgi:hypothetical protein